MDTSVRCCFRITRATGEENDGQWNYFFRSLATFLVKAANIPASTVGVIEVPYRGRTLKIAGDRTYEPWTITALNDKGFALRSKFEEWSTKIQALHQNLQSPRVIAEYQSDAMVIVVSMIDKVQLLDLTSL